MTRHRRRARHPAPPALFGDGGSGRGWLYGFLLVVATATAYLPAFSAEFIHWDDTAYVAGNELLRTREGLRDIWNPVAGKVPQYYPLVFTSYWLEYRVWGLMAAGYHTTNVALHALNALLALFLVRRLGASLEVAAGAAAVFALHPVQVESVLWVTERKNVLSGCFYLAAALLYLRHRRLGSWPAYAGACSAFAAALLSKTQTLTLPLVLFISDWLLQRSRLVRALPTKRVLVRLTPMFALAALAAVVTPVVEQQMVHSVRLPSAAQRLLAGATAPWFYLGKFLMPVWLAPIYPKWVVDPTAPVWWVAIASWIGVAVALHRYHGRLGALPLWGAAQFLVPLLPALGVLPFSYLNYSYVADRFVYLSCLGAGVVTAAIAGRLARRGRDARRALVASALAILVACGVQTYRQAVHWRTDFAFWTHVFDRNPESYPPNVNLGQTLWLQGRAREALPFLERAQRLEPELSIPLRLYLTVLAAVRGPQVVIDTCNEVIRRRSGPAHVAYLYRGLNYEALGRAAEARADYDRVLSLAGPSSTSWQEARQRRARLQTGQIGHR